MEPLNIIGKQLKACDRCGKNFLGRSWETKCDRCYAVSGCATTLVGIVLILVASFAVASGILLAIKLFV